MCKENNASKFLLTSSYLVKLTTHDRIQINRKRNFLSILVFEADYACWITPHLQKHTMSFDIRTRIRLGILVKLSSTTAKGYQGQLSSSTGNPTGITYSNSIGCQALKLQHAANLIITVHSHLSTESSPISLNVSVLFTVRFKE